MKKLINKKFNLPILTIFAIGIIFGIIFLFFINELDKLIIKTEIENYFNLISTNEINKLNAFIDSFKNNFIYLTIIWVSSITLLFTPLTAFIIFYKGFLSGFITSSLIMVFGVKGFIYSFLFMFPHEILNIVLILIFTLIMLSTSFKILKNIYTNGTINLRIFFKKIIIVYLIGIVALLIISLLEIYVSYPLLVFFF